MKCEEACKLVDAEGGGGATINTTKKNKSESYSINDDVNDYGDWKPSNKSSNNYSESNNTASNDYSSLDYGSSSNSSISEESNDTSESSSSWDDNDSSDNSSWWDNDDTSESSSSWDDDTSDNSSWWDNDDTSESSSSWDDDTSNNSSSWDDNDMSESSSWWNDYTSDNSSWWDNDDTSENSNSVEVEFDNKTSNYLVNDDQIPNNHNSWQENISNKGQQGLDYSEKIEDKTEETITPNETLVSFEDKTEPQIPVNPSENENSMLTDNSQDQINVIVDAPSIEVVSSETNLTPASNSTNETITDTNADMLNADTKTINDIPAEQHEETNTDKINISENNPILEDAAESSLVNTSNPEIIPIDSGASTTANSDGTPQKMENTPIESVDSKEGIVHEHKTHILDTPQIIDDTPYHPVNKKEEPINTEASNAKSFIKKKDSTKEHTTHILDTPQMIDDKPYHPVNKKEEPINTEARNAKSFIKKKNSTNGHTTHILDVAKEKNISNISNNKYTEKKAQNIIERGITTELRSPRQKYFSQTIIGIRADILDTYYNNRLEKKTLPFNENYNLNQKILPMQLDENGKPIYPYACQYFAVVSAFVNAGYKYVDGLTVDEVEKIANTAMNEGIGYTDLIKKVFGVDAVYHKIPKGISMENFKSMVGNNPSLLKFTQKDFWGTHFPENEYHGVGYANGGFFEAWLGRHGERWEEARGRNSESDFATNKGGFYFEVRN